MIRGMTAVLLLWLAAVPAAAQSRTVQDDEWCNERWYGEHDRAQVCEVREHRLPARERLAIDGRANGGITVRAWNRDEIVIRAKVQAEADDEQDARAIASAVTVEAGGTMVRADGPETNRHDHWAVSYRVFVPRRTNLSLETTNGGIGVYDVMGRIDVEATNGGVRLEGLGGNVRGRTTNGGLHVELSGDQWDGQGMDVRTTNGGVRIVIPDGYSARLEAGTTNGRLRIDFPITVQGRIDRRITTDLGRGGKLVRVTTTNGGVVVTKR
jgi:DUF4097 and DUF4098 domain-containing protein YvlB